MVSNPKDAKIISDKLESAVALFSECIEIASAPGACNERDLSSIKETLGISIGQIDAKVISKIYAAHPQLKSN